MFVNIIFFIFQNLLKRACYSSIMDIPPVPNQPTSFIFPQRSLGKANPVKRSFQASWFSTRTWLYHTETNKISSTSRAKIVPKCIKIVRTDVRKYKIFRTPLTRGGMPPLVLSPNSCLRHLLNVIDISWPDHFSKADDSPDETSPL